MNHSPAMGAQNGFEELPKRPQKWIISKRWALKMVSKSYQNDHTNEPFPSDGRSKWFRKVTKTSTKTNHSPMMGAQTVRYSQWDANFASLSFSCHPGSPSLEYISLIRDEPHFHVIPDHWNEERSKLRGARWSRAESLYSSGRHSPRREKTRGERAGRALSLVYYNKTLNLLKVN